MINTQLKSTQLPNRIEQPSSQINLFTAEVVDIILSNDNKKFDSFGGLNSIGTIIYRKIESNKTKNLDTLNYAIPLLPHQKTYPIVNENVLIFSGIASSKTTNKESLTVSYYLPINTLNNSNSNNISENKDFPKITNHATVLPNIGDVITEGRFNNSLKFSADEKGNPLTIIRNGRKVETTNGEFLQENINEDESTIVFSSKQIVPIDLAYDKLNSFSASMSKSADKSIKTIDVNKNNSVEDLAQVNKSEFIKEVDLTQTETIEEENIVDFIQGKGNNNNEVKLDDIEQEHASIITQEKHTEIYNNTKNLTKLSNPISFNNVTKYIGSVELDIPVHIKAIMDVLAFCEGTLGLNRNNGYDTVVLNCRTISNWINDYKLGCPYEVVYGKKGLIFQKGGHWGRYQYAKATWKIDNNGLNIAFSKRNQDLTCAKTIKRRLGYILYDNLHNTMQSIGGVHQVCLKLAPEWASIPNGNSSNSYYNNQNVRILAVDIQKLYNLAYNIYRKK
jgi:muramidase (phage lysozyme)